MSRTGVPDFVGEYELEGCDSWCLRTILRAIWESAQSRLKAPSKPTTSAAIRKLRTAAFIVLDAAPALETSSNEERYVRWLSSALLAKATDLERRLPRRDDRRYVALHAPIARLVAFVRCSTGRSHYRELSVLIADLAPGCFRTERGMAKWVDKHVRDLVRAYTDAADKIGADGAERLMLFAGISRDARSLDAAHFRRFMPRRQVQRDATPTDRRIGDFIERTFDSMTEVMQSSGA